MSSTAFCREGCSDWSCIFKEILLHYKERGNWLPASWVFLETRTLLRALGDEVRHLRRAAQEVARWFPPALAHFLTRWWRSTVFFCWEEQIEDYHKLVISVICMWGDSMVATAVGSRTHSRPVCLGQVGRWRLHLLECERGNAWGQILGEALESRFQDLEAKN